MVADPQRVGVAAYERPGGARNAGDGDGDGTGEGAAGPANMADNAGGTSLVLRLAKGTVVVDVAFKAARCARRAFFVGTSVGRRGEK